MSRPLSTTRRTRIVATIGPASDAPEVLSAMETAGMDVARVPLAHGTLDDAIARIRRIRSAAPSVAVLVDLPGPKIRSSPFTEGGVVLEAGSEVRLSPGSHRDTSSAAHVGVALDEAVAGLEEGDPIAFGDGGVLLRVLRRDGDDAIALVVAGGPLQGRPGVTVPERRVQLTSPTPQDLIYAEALLEEGVEIVAASFVRSASDMQALRAIAGNDTLLCAKIETADAIDHLHEILVVSDSVMVARGDLGVRLPLEDIPFAQKDIIRAGVAFGRPVITATQMLESMAVSPVPTRAEVTDVANAVLDGTSAVMLSGESAIGAHPIGAVAHMALITERAERSFDYESWGGSLGPQEISSDPSSTARITVSVTRAAWRAALDEDAVAIVACTRSGATARAISRFRPPMPIIATTPRVSTMRQLQLSWGVEALLVDVAESTDEVVMSAVDATVAAGKAKTGDVVVVLVGSPSKSESVTDTMRVVRIS